MSEENTENLLHITENIFCQCPVCNRLDTEDTELFAEYIEVCCKKHSLSVVLKLALEFCKMMKTRRHTKQAKTNSATSIESKNYDFENIEVIRHVLYCVSTKSTNLRQMICNAKSMQMLLESQTIGQTSTAIKLLQTSQGSTAKSAPVDS